MAWKCGRCSYIHIQSKGAERMPSRCPSCSSSRLSKITADVDEEFRNPQPFKRDAAGILRVLSRLNRMTVDEQESVRKELKLEGVHVLTTDWSWGSLVRQLSKEEADGYFSLVQKQEFGLALVGTVAVAVSPLSPLRRHVGVTPNLLAELKNAATSGQALNSRSSSA